MTSMKLIAHRGNVDGPSSWQNDPTYVLQALSKGFEAQVDVWRIADEWFLGHGFPQYKISYLFLQTVGLWCHAKNYEALLKMLDMGVHCFWHQEDDYTVTSKGIVWAYPFKPVSINTVTLLFQRDLRIPAGVYGICSDYIQSYKKIV